MRKLFKKIICLLIIIGFNWTGLSTVGGTFATFNDADTITNSTYTAGTLNLSAEFLNSGFEEEGSVNNMEPGDSVEAKLRVRNQGSLPLKYSGSFEKIGGDDDLCQSLQLKAELDGNEQYNGPLSIFNFLPVNLSDSSVYHTWDLEISLSSSAPGFLSNKICRFNLVFDASQQGTIEGFSDQAKVEDTIKAGEWESAIVLNEFLPNAGDYPEFIELYNKTGSDMDLAGYYIDTGQDIILIDTNTTDKYSSGSTVVPAYSWLVVTSGGDKMNNSAGTITLYDPNNIEMDSYTYNGAENNVNNSPSWTNDLVAYLPFDGDLLDKSGNGHNGSFSGDSLIVSSGKINQALSLDGSGDFVDIADSDDFDFGSGEFTLEAWFKTDNSSRQWLLTRYQNYGPGWGMGIQNGYALGYIRTTESGSGKKEISGSANVSDNSWHHLIMVRTGDKIKIYTDGQIETEGVLAGNANNDESIEIGRISYSGGSQYFSGLIDEVKIYNRVLDDSEILAHYNAVTATGEVPADKSYARIPDGSDNWVDPIPTPGGPNKTIEENYTQKITAPKAIDAYINTPIPAEETASSTVDVEELVFTTTEETATSTATTVTTATINTSNTASTTDTVEDNTATTTLIETSSTEDIVTTATSTAVNTKIATTTQTKATSTEEQHVENSFTLNEPVEEQPKIPEDEDDNQDTEEDEADLGDNEDSEGEEQEQTNNQEQENEE